MTPASSSGEQRNQRNDPRTAPAPKFISLHSLDQQGPRTGEQRRIRKSNRPGGSRRIPRFSPGAAQALSCAPASASEPRDVQTAAISALGTEWPPQIILAGQSRQFTRACSARHRCVGVHCGSYQLHSVGLSERPIRLPFQIAQCSRKHSSTLTEQALLAETDESIVGTSTRSPGGSTRYPRFSPGAKAVGGTHVHLPPRAVEPFMQSSARQCMYMPGMLWSNPRQSEKVQCQKPSRHIAASVLRIFAEHSVS